MADRHSYHTDQLVLFHGAARPAAAGPHWRPTMDATTSPSATPTIPADRLLRPDDAGYDEARQVWNGMIAHRPAVIARVESTDEVVAALALARAEGLPVSIRGGGHNVAGLAVGDGALVVDLSAMSSVCGGPGRAPGPRRRRRPMGGSRRGRAGARAGDPRRRRLRNGRRGPHAERRARLAAPQARPQLRCASCGHGGHRGRPRRPRERRRARRPVLGPPRRRRQLRGRDRVRVRALPGGPDRRHDRRHLADRRGGRGPARVPRAGSDPARRGLAGRRAVSRPR